MKYFYRFLFALSFFVIFPGFASAEVRSIARSGDTATGLPAGTTFQYLVNRGVGTFMVPPQISAASGHTIFTGEITGPNIFGNKGTIWSATPVGAPELVLRVGDPAPGLPGIILSPNAPIIDSLGNLAFTGTLAGSGVTSSNDMSVWSRMGNNLQLSAREGSPAFGLQDGALYSTLQDLLFTGAPGQTKLTFKSQLTGSSVNGTNNLAVGSSLLQPSGLPTPVLDLRIGQYVPGDSVARFLSISRRVGAGGKSAYGSGLFGVNLPPESDTGIWTDQSGTITLVAREGDPAPGTVPGAVFSTLYDPSGSITFVNRTGYTAFFGRVSGSGVSNLNDSGLWSNRTGTLQPVFIERIQVPGYPAGVIFSDQSVSITTSPVFDDSGAITINAKIRGTGISTGVNDVILVRSELNGQLSTIATAGTQVPGLPAGVNFSSVILGDNLSSNGNGDLIFRAGLSGPGVDGTNDYAVLAYQDGQLRTVLRKGSTLDGWVIKTIYNLKPQINEAGEAVFSIAGVSPDDPSFSNSSVALVGVNSSGIPHIIAGEKANIAIANSPSEYVTTIAFSDTNALADDGRVVFAARLSGSTVNEAVLEYQISDNVGNPCPADYNNSGSADVTDIFDFLSAWFAGNGDFNGSGQTAVDDIFAFLNAWFVGC